MNKFFCLSICVITSLAGMEQQYLDDYRTLVAIKSRIFELAAQVTRDHKGSSSMVLMPCSVKTDGYWRGDFQNQTEQGFGLVWESGMPTTILWKLGSFNIVGTTSSVNKGHELLLKEIIQEFDAIEISRKPRVLQTLSSKQIPIEGEEIVMYALNRFGQRSLPQLLFKKSTALMTAETAKKIYKQLETQ